MVVIIHVYGCGGHLRHGTRDDVPMDGSHCMGIL